MCHDSLTVEPQAQNMMRTRCFEEEHGLVLPTYELVVVSKPSVGFPEALLLTDRRQVAQGLVAPVVQLGYAGPRSPLHSALSNQISKTKGPDQGGQIVEGQVSPAWKCCAIPPCM